MVYNKEMKAADAHRRQEVEQIYTVQQTTTI
jgi:hypothetical protein